MIAVIDETTIESGKGFIYVIASVAIIEDATLAQMTLAGVTQGRQRPFHWVKEGPEARQRMVAAVDQLGAIAAGFQQGCGRRGQDKTRSILLADALLWAVGEGADGVIIESRGRKLDVQDKRVVKQLRSAGHPIPDVRWDTKSNPLLWLADSVCGAHRERHHQEVVGGVVSPEAARLIMVANLEVNYVQK